MTANSYPHLGWNPVPGIPDEVDTLRSKISRSASALAAAHSRIERLIGESGYWEGDAAQAFRDALDGDFSTYVKNAAHSLEKAAKQLSLWHSDLLSYRDLAQKYDAAAADKKTALTAANGRYNAAKQNPDLGLAGTTFSSQTELDNAQSRLDTATTELNSAANAVNHAQGALNDIIAKAKELETTHADQAEKIARALDDATDKLAPKGPNWLSKALGATWDGLKAVGEFLYAHIGTIGAIAGLLALIPGPWTPVFAGIAVACSAVALIGDLSDSETRKALLHPGLNMDTLSAVTSVGGDVLGMVPGVGALGKAGSEAIFAAKLARESGEMLSMATHASNFVREVVPVFRSDVVASAAEIARGGLAKKSIEYGMAGVGAVTAGYGDLEDAGVLPDHGAAHNVNEGAGNAATAYGGYGAVGTLKDTIGELGAALSLRAAG